MGENMSESIQTVSSIGLKAGARNRLEFLVVGAVFRCRRQGKGNCPFKDINHLSVADRAKLVLMMTDDELIKAVDAHEKCPCHNGA